MGLRAQATIATNFYDGVYAHIAGAADIDEDGGLDLVVACSQVERVSGLNTGNLAGPRSVRRYHENRILVLASDLKEKFSFQVPGAFHDTWQMEIYFGDFTDQGHCELLLVGETASILRLEPPAQRPGALSLSSPNAASIGDQVSSAYLPNSK